MACRDGLHFIKDRWWDEDRQWSIRPGLAERLASLRNAALTVLRLIPGLPDDLPIRARADHLGRRLRKALKFIGASNDDFAILLRVESGLFLGLREDAESHIAPDPAIELGTRLANWLVPVVLAVVGFSAIYGLRAGPAAGSYDTVQPVPVAGQQPPTRSEIAIGRDPLLGNLSPSRPLTRATGSAGSRPGIPLLSPDLAELAVVWLPNGSPIEVIEGSACHRLIQFLDSPEAATRGEFVLEEISFDRATSSLSIASEPAIKRLARILEAYPAASVVLIERGASPADAARAVHRRLIELGLDQARIVIGSPEASRPPSARNEAGAPVNACVELVVTPHP